MSYRLLGFSSLVLAALVVVAARTMFELERDARAKVGREGQSGPSSGQATPDTLPSLPSSPPVVNPPTAGVHGAGGSPSTAGPVPLDDTAAAARRLLDLHGFAR